MRVFADSEGAEEGAALGKLTEGLLNLHDEQSVLCFTANEVGMVVGSIIFSPLELEHGPLVYLLSPVAIDTAVQGQGIGQQLIRYGLESLTSRGVSMVVTYGDLAFYSKVGFEPITENIIEPPFPLSQPEGWLAQSLTGQALSPIEEKPRCVEPFRQPEYW